jgi:toxin FitB
MSGMIVLDTNVISEVVRSSGDARVGRALAGMLERQVYTTATTVAELLGGVATMPVGRRQRELADAIGRVLETRIQGRIVPFDRAAAIEYAAVVAGRTRAGRPIDAMDAQIAAMVRVHDAILVTRNVRDFEGCGIEVVNPWG